MSANGRNRGGWTPTALVYVKRVNAILDDLREYWPVTLRQVYYQLVAGQVIENCEAEYKKLSRTLAKARIDGLVTWDAIEDRARSTLDSAGWVDKSQYAEAVISALDDYRRDLLQSQDVALEVWIEKDALSDICHRAAKPYCVRVIVARGFSSISYVHECQKRVKQNAEAGKRTVILYFGDLDPSGWEMLPSMMETLQEEMGLGDLVEGKRYALTPEQVTAYNLPQSIDAMKDADTRTPKFKDMLRENGYPDTLAVELDALPPATLETLVREAIEENLDLSKFGAEQQREEAEREALAELRGRVTQIVEEML